MSDRWWQVFLTLEAIALGVCIGLGVLTLLAPLVIEYAPRITQILRGLPS